jgi:hypothetical protein
MVDLPFQGRPPISLDSQRLEGHPVGATQKCVFNSCPTPTSQIELTTHSRSVVDRLDSYLITEQFDGSEASKGRIPLSLTIRPACGFPGEYRFPTDSEELMRLLRQKTNLSGSVLEKFESKLYALSGARLLGVELSESVLTDIGYFID